MRHNSLAILGLTLLAAGIAAAETRVVAGGVEGTWTVSGSPYIILGDITVPSDATLKIGPRVVVRFAGPYKLIVHGTLDARVREIELLRRRNIEDHTIRFTTDKDANPEGWGGIRFIGAEDDCRLEGCVIEFARVSGEGADGTGGGVYCEDSELSMSDCVVHSNFAALRGGGIACVSSKVSLANCSIVENEAGELGGGVYAEDSELSLASVALNDNRGGGLACVDDSEVSLANCTINDNKGAKQGGGVYASGANVVIANASIDENEKGGIVLLDRATVSITNCSMRENYGVEQGGAVYCVASELALTNAAIDGNVAGGIYCLDNAVLRLINVAVRDGGRAAGITSDGSCTITRVNVVVND